MDAKPVRSVLITDVDNTLFDWVHVWHAAFSAMLAELLRLSRLDESVLLAEIRKVHQRAGTSEYSFLIGELGVLRGPAGETPVQQVLAPAEAAAQAADALQVIGPVAVLPLKSGGERYVYRGAPVGDEFTDEGIAHAQAIGLVGKK